MSKAGVLIWRHIFESGDAKRLALQVQDISDLHIIRDIPYINDGEQGHLADIYELPDLPDEAPVFFNIHGGGLFASYKEVNVNFNYEWARMGYRVVSISYRRIPEATLWHQIDDVMAALRFFRENAAQYHLNLENAYLCGDSAGALLSLFALSLHSSEKLRRDFAIEDHGIFFKAAGFISIMLDTQRRDLMMAISSAVTDRKDRKKPCAKYLLDPSKLLEEAVLPPLFMVTSAEDLIQKDTLKLDRLLYRKNIKHTVKNFPEGEENELVHVFSVMYPMYKESREVYSLMDAYFKEEGR